MTGRSRQKGPAGRDSRTRRRAGGITALVVVSLCLVASIVYQPLRYGPAVQSPAWVSGVREGRLDSASCISCHQEAGELWQGSQHHLANRVLKASNSLAPFHGETAATHAADYLFTRDAEGRPLIREKRRDGTVREHLPSMVIAQYPLRQYLVPAGSGRFQATEVAWDPQKQEWFGVYGNEERNPGEWGHWTGQSMTWNSMCARCHMTGYDKRYDEKQDAYESRWIEQGVGCVQCHGPMTGHEAGGKALARVDNISRDPPRMMQTCASCHARAEDLTESFPPGAAFDDHFRLELMVAGRFHPDGQILDEDFEWGSFRHSKMHTAGVTCLDCHSAHTGKLRLPLENNSVCMQCHAPGNTRNAPVIDPTGHSFHKPDSTGNRCVECHMVKTTYMQRDPRRDHGFIIPDPQLTREFEIPNACSRCHEDKPLEWNIEAWEKWYGPSGKAEPRRARTRAVARAHRDDTTVVPELVRLIALEKSAGWRASLLTLAAGLAPGSDSVVAAATSARADPDGLVRAAAIRALGDHPSSRGLVRDALHDPVRLVRLDAAWRLSSELAEGSLERREFDAYLDAFIESPIALLRRGQDRFNRGRRQEGIVDLQKAVALDPLSPPLPEALGFMFSATSQPAAAAVQFERAAALLPRDPTPAFYAALSWAEVGDMAKTERQLRAALERDPGHARAGYNLGLLLAQNGRADEALAMLATAERADSRDPAIPYAAATILAQSGRRAAAIEAARRALAINPNMREATDLIEVLARSETAR